METKMYFASFLAVLEFLADFQFEFLPRSTEASA